MFKFFDFYLLQQNQDLLQNCENENLELHFHNFALNL